MVQILLILNGICLASKQNIRQKDDQKKRIYLCLYYK